MSSKYGVRFTYDPRAGAAPIINKFDFGDTVADNFASTLGYLVDIASLLNYRYDYTVGANRLQAVRPPAEQLTFTVQYIDSTPRLLALLPSAAAYDIANNSPSTLTLFVDGVEDLSLQGFIVGRNVSDYAAKQGNVCIEYVFQPLPRPWFRSKVLSSDNGWNFGELPADVQIELYATQGAVVDPVVTISNVRGFSNEYAFSGLTIPDSSRVTISTRDHSIIMGDASVYQYRDSGAKGSGRYIFEQLPTYKRSEVPNEKFTATVTATSGSPLLIVRVLENYRQTRWGAS